MFKFLTIIISLKFYMCNSLGALLKNMMLITQYFVFHIIVAFPRRKNLVFITERELFSSLFQQLSLILNDFMLNSIWKWKCNLRKIKLPGHVWSYLSPQ